MTIVPERSTQRHEIKIRLYTTDIDLLSLYAEGYPITDMIGRALIAYVHNKPLRFHIDRAVDFDFNRIVRNRGGNRVGTTSDGTQAQLTVTIDDPTAIEFCRTSIKARYRCKFLKMLLRYSLDGVAPVGAYLTSDKKRKACASYFLSPEEEVSIIDVDAGKPKRILADRLLKAKDKHEGTNKTADSRTKKRGKPLDDYRPATDVPVPQIQEAAHVKREEDLEFIISEPVDAEKMEMPARMAPSDGARDSAKSTTDSGPLQQSFLKSFDALTFGDDEDDNNEEG